VYRVISVVAGPLQGEDYVFQERVEIGRSGDLAVQLIGSAVSRRHAEVRIESEGTALLTDLNSRNGTFVDGERIGTHVLVSGDTFEIGSSSFRFEIRQGDPPSPQNDLQLSLMSGPAEDVTEIYQRSRPGAPPRPTTVPGSQGSGACDDPLHATAADQGWRFCPVCGEPPNEGKTGEHTIPPRSDAH
jgi:predicted component of type VI protein secretion system